MLLRPVPAAAADPWTTRDTVLQTSVLTLMWLDYKQTLQIAAGRDHVVETNALMGTDPTRRDVNRFFAAGAVLHTAIAAFLPKDYRLFWQSVQIGITYEAIRNNYELGIAIRF